MRNRINALKMLQYFLAGFIISAFGCSMFIVALYVTFPMIVQFIMPLPSIFIVYSVLKKGNYKSLLIGIIFIIIGSVVAEIVLHYLHIMDYFYYKCYPDAIEYSMGAGILLAFIWICNFIGSIIGIIAGFISVRHQKR